MERNKKKERNQLSLRQKGAIIATGWAKKVAVKKAYKEMVKTSEKHRAFIDEIQEKCADIIELEPQEKQASIVATVCANIIQGFDTKQEMKMVVQMIETAIEEYWKIKNIPQSQE